MNTTYLSLGTNLGDRHANLQAAVAALPPQLEVLSRSGIYETPAWGYEDQPAFLNMAVKAGTDLPPIELLAHLKKLETGLGRQPSFHWGPRLIDIDILFYDDLVMDTPGLVIPHAHLQERAFVLVPLAEIAPDLLHPGLGKTVRQLLAGVDRAGIRPVPGPRS
jgi:2-amino-4-hydroxy-6-hydroxymethyldihydropteridine diphosphokinase